MTTWSEDYSVDRKKNLVLRVGGEGGEGVITTGELLTLSAARLGLEVYTFRTYPAEIKGGYAMYQVRVSPELLLSQGDQLDILVCFNQEAFDVSLKDLKEEGVLLYDSSEFTPKEPLSRCTYGVPVTELANKELRNKRTKNILFLGICSALFGFPFEVLDEIVRKRFARKGEAVLDLNARALRLGFDYVRQNIQKADHYFLEGKPSEQRGLLLSGNEALALGALAAGVRFYAGYPITPATDIMEFLAEQLPRFGGTVMQVEDEIAALSMVMGASYTGMKAMTATSGPGFSLMTELVGLAGMAEIPTVIVDVQRGGPSTGMPTKTEQGDLYHACFGGHSETPRIVLALASVKDCFFGIIRAFNMAEKYQVPVIVLSDQYLAQRKAKIEKPDLSKIRSESRLRPDPLTLQRGYERFRITDTGVSPMSIPGVAGGFYTATGLEHDEMGEPKYSPDHHTKMTEKRFKKLKGLRHEPAENLFRRWGVEDPEIGVLSWGSSEGVVREAVGEAVRLGYRVAALHPRLIYPLPEEIIAEFLKPLKAVIVPELNYQGQYANLLRSKFKVDFIQLNKVSGLPFSPREILAKIEDVETRCLV